MAHFHAQNVVVTPELVQALQAAHKVADDVCAMLVTRHEGGDWGEIHANQSVVNDVAVTLGKGTAKSVYEVGGVGEVWVMTSLNAARGFAPKTYVLLARQSFDPN